MVFVLMLNDYIISSTMAFLRLGRSYLCRMFIILNGLLLLSSHAYALQPNAVSNLMRGLSTPACIALVQEVEKDLIPDNLAIKTLPTVKQGSKIFSAISIVNYNGDDSHITLDAMPSGDNQCRVSYNETFSFAGPCIIAREQLFRKWIFLGKMIDTMVFKFKRDEKLLGYLTTQGNNRTCLVQKRKTFYK